MQGRQRTRDSREAKKGEGRGLASALLLMLPHSLTNSPTSVRRKNAKKRKEKSAKKRRGKDGRKRKGKNGRKRRRRNVKRWRGKERSDFASLRLTIDVPFEGTDETDFKRRYSRISRINGIVASNYCINDPKAIPVLSGTIARVQNCV